MIIVDDVRCGFRLDLAGSSKHYGFNADIQCFGKAMANGYAISVAAAREALMDAAKKHIFYRHPLLFGRSFCRRPGVYRRNSGQRRNRKYQKDGDHADGRPEGCRKRRGRTG